jgi:hypothetical protein
MNESEEKQTENTGSGSSGKRSEESKSILESEMGESASESQSKVLCSRIKTVFKRHWRFIAGFFLIPYIVSFFFPWTGINCLDEEINIQSGKARYTRKFWFVPIYIKTRDTAFSLALGGEKIDVPSRKRSVWQTVNTFSPGVENSPQYAFHGAFHEAWMLEKLRDEYGLPPSEIRDLARQTLISWQTKGARPSLLIYDRLKLEESRHPNQQSLLL